MPLPKVSTPTFELNLISTGKAVKYRPFLVKEEKALLIALESGDEKTIQNTLKDVLKACITSRGVKVDELPSFDLEYLFLNIRAKSVGETVELLVTCTDDGETQVPLKIHTSEIVLDVPDEHNESIDLGEGLKMTLKYPSLKQFVENNFLVSESVDDDAIAKAFAAVVDCVDTIYNEEEAWSASDCTKKELTSFVEGMTSTQFAEIERFFSTMPRLTYRGSVVNPNTKVESEILIEGLSNFFA